MISSSLGDRTLAGLLRHRAAERPDREAFVYLADGEEADARLTLAELDRRARSVAAALRESLEPGDRALLLFPPGLEFIVAFFGCLYAGVLAVPAYPPRPNDRSQLRLRAIARDAEPLAALTTGPILRALAAAPLPELAALRWIAIEELDGTDVDLPEPDPDAVAFLQYTSGSTAAPKGVRVTHSNLLHNERMIAEAFAQDEDSVVVGWLPLYHDMGLIGNVLQPLHAGARAVLMPPVAFLQKPLRWLEAISRYRGTTSGGPNFAYELCVRRIQPEQRQALDLSSWRVAFNGAEPVRAETLERFTEAFGPHGFRREAFYPCYGLAEATLLVSGGAVNRSPRIETVETRRLVSCGHAWGDQRIAIVDPEAGAELAPGQVGEIWVAGPSVADGYWRNAEATQRDFAARLADTGEGPFLRTGDLGALLGGEVFVTGRIKDLVILRGRNHYPQDLEATAERSHPDLRPGNGAAFSVDVAGEERLVVVQEVERRRREGFENLADTIRQAVAEEHEVQVHDVVLVRAGTVPKTSSGKVQRRLCRERYLAGELSAVGRSALTRTEAEPSPVLRREALTGLEPAERRTILERYLRERAAAALRVAPEAIEPERALTSLGLDSLSAMEIQGSVEADLGAALPIAELLEGAGIARLAESLLVSLEAEPEAAFVAGEEHSRLSYGEKALWFLDRLAPEGGAYNIAVAARARGLDPEALRRALEALSVRHAALRTIFPSVDGEPVRRVLDRPNLDFREQTEERPTEAAYRPFSLETGPLVRVRIFDSGEGEPILLWVVHHIVADFASLAILARELGALYRREAADLPALPSTYPDFVRWQEERLAGPRGARLWSYWSQALAGVPDLDLPADRSRPPVQTYSGRTAALELPADLADAIQALASSRGATLYMVLLAAFQVLLGRYTRQEDLAVGSPTSGRGAPGFVGLVGYFVNPVVLRADLTGAPSFAKFLDRTRSAVLAALEHAEAPFALLAERLRPVRDPARSPLFQAMLVLQRGRPQDAPGLAAFALGEEGSPIDLGSLTLEPVALAERRSPFELSLRLAETPEGTLLASLEHNADLFDPTTAMRILEHFRTLVTLAAAEPDRRISDLPLLTEPERQALLVEWAATQTRPPDDLCLHELVEAQAARTPDNPAVISDNGDLTYRELLERSIRLADHLTLLGVGPETVVGLSAERSPDLVVGVLGILQAGAAYLPLDPALPPERLSYMLDDAHATIVLTQKHLPVQAATVVLLDPDTPDGSWPGAAVPAQRLDAPQAHPKERSGDRRPRATPDSLAYVIYTSGSTGRPKGVAVPHRGVVNRLLEAHHRLGLTPADSILHRASIGFDASVWEILSPLVAGGRLILARPGGHQDLAYLVRALAESQVSIVHFVPSILEVLVSEPGLNLSAGTLRLMISGGEALSADLRDRFTALLPATKLVNVYGPTEASIDVLWHVCPSGEKSTTVPIGRPITGCTARILDGSFQPVPAGVPGELYLGGVCLVRGYLGRPDLTAERFLPDPYGPAGERLYRTGDLARWQAAADGEIEFLGRVDQQVKIRGIRIELGEIEVALARHPAVREAAAAVHESPAAGRRLMAHVVPLGSRPEPSELRRFLAASLPEAMVPGAFVFHERLPRTASGKLDRRQLSALSPEPATAGTFAAPRTPIEMRLAGLYCDLLGVERVGLHDSFFELGGHSLLAVRATFRLAEAFGVEVPVSALLQNPTVAGLARWLEAGEGRSAAGNLTANLAGDRASFPLSLAQQRLWLIDRLNPGNAAYNQGLALRLEGDLQIGPLAASLREIVRRHEPLRTIFSEADGEPVQIVLPPPSGIELPRLDLSVLSPELQRATLREAIRAELGRQLDLERGPMVRFVLARLGAAEHVLAATFHHIATDGWSMEVFFREMVSFYDAATRGRPFLLPEPPLRYVDFAVWQRQALTPEILETQLAYWRRQLAGQSVLEFPADRPRSPRASRSGAALPFGLPPSLVEGLRALGRTEGTTLFVSLLSGLAALMGRYSGQDDLSLGIPAAGRSRRETEGLIGFFVNTLVVRIRTEKDPGFQELTRQVRDLVLGAQAHQDVPFERVVEELQPERDPSLSPLFQVMLTFLSLSREPLQTPGLSVSLLESEVVTAKLDLLLSLYEREGTVQGHLEYRTDLFEEATAARLLGHLRTLLAAAVEAPGTRLSELPLLSEAERGQLLQEWSDGGPIPASDLRLHDLVAAQAARTPDQEAVAGKEEKLTYRQLILRAGRIARTLRGLGVQPEDRVGIGLRRTPDLVAAILGVLEAGGAYVPLDPAYPEDRLRHMLADSGARVLLAEAETAARLAFFEGRTILLEDLHPRPLSHPGGESPPASGNLAYVIYTSGSTGKPKGVAIEHRSAVALVQWALGTFSPADLGGVLFATSVCFDLSVFEMFVPLAAGGRVIVAEDALELPQLADRGITLVNTVPSAMSELVRGDLPASLRTVNLAGEALPAELVRRIHAHPGVESVYNLYGPSEDTTYSTFARIARSDAGAGAPPIGRPIAGTSAYAAGRRGELLPAGIPGELWLGGDGLARGYLGRPAATAERFVPDPFGVGFGARLYRTGDLVRWRPDGQLHYLGRIDHQVKVRGFRIELGEIEAALAFHREVGETVVMARGEGADRELVAYVVPQLQAGGLPAEPPWSSYGNDPTRGSLSHRLVPDLRRHLEASLPEPMRPSSFVLLPSLPRMPNGKVDRRALAGVVESGVERAASQVYLAPRTPLEESLTQLWVEVLGEERTGGRIGVQDDFFELGGHSLLAVRAAFRVSEAFGVEVPASALFQHRTVADFARWLESGKARPARNLSARSPEGGRIAFPLALAQQRLWLIDRLSPGNAAYNQGLAVRLEGDLRSEALAAGLREILRRHEPLRTIFSEAGGEPVQIVLPLASEIDLPRWDLSGLPLGSRENELRTAIREELGRPFDLERGPMVRFALVRLGMDEHVLAATFHHIATDGWSLEVFFRDLVAFYDAAVSGQPCSLPELPLRYVDFAVWQRQALTPEILDAQLAYWRQQLADAPLLELPLDHPRRPPASPGSHPGAALPFHFAPELIDGLRELGRGEGLTLFASVLAGLAALMGRYSGQDDLAIGIPSAGRSRRETESLIGFFVNTLVLRVRTEGDPSFRALAAQVRDLVLSAQAHQDVPFERVVEELQPERDPSLSPLFQVMLTFLSLSREPLQATGLSASLLEPEVVTAKFDLLLGLYEWESLANGHLEYRSDLFEEATAIRLLEHLRTLLAGAVASPGARLSELPLLSEAERRQLLQEWSDGGPWPAQDLRLHDLVAAQAARTPAAEAVAGKGSRLTYRDLMLRSGQIARALQDLGLRPEDRVGIGLSRSPDLVAAILGVLEAGGAYVPLDPAYPEDRLRHMLSDSGARVLLAEAETADRMAFFEGRTILLEDPPPRPLSHPHSHPPGGEDSPASGNLAYVIYTSGSTGLPKGVAIEHRSIVTLVLWALTVFGMEELAGVLFATSVCFDLSLFEMFAPLAVGGRVIVAEDALELPRLKDRAVTLVNTVPSAMSELARGDLPASLRTVNLAGEALPAELVQRIYEHPGVERVYNLYGPSEDTTYSTFARIARQATGAPPIGRPIAGTRAFVVGRHGEPVPAGVAGELWLSGAGLARGYLGRPATTAERFVPDPFGPVSGARLYRTGDLARWLPDGQLHYLGRIDHQVKVRGFRIELGEIESALARHRDVGEAAVLARGEGGDRQLVAYVVPRAEAEEAAGAGGGAEGAFQHVDQWQGAWNEAYTREPRPGDEGDPTFDIRGWNSSYTGEPIPEAEMRAWLDASVERLLALPHRRVLEIGCGTGLLLFRVAPHAELYRATDFSAVVIESLRRKLAGRDLPQVELARRPAHDWSGIEPGSFDLVVLNSVIQYFPRMDYLARVLEEAVRAVAPGGAVFVGDVRSRPLLEAFHTSVELSQAPGSLSIAELQERVRRRIAEEEELAVDPEFFFTMARHLLSPTRAEVLMKRGSHANEMSLFRFDAVLRVGEAGEAVEAPAEEEGLPWSSYGNDPMHGDLARRLVPELRRFLETSLPEPMVPSAFVLLGSLPRTLNGKVDRRALAEVAPVRGGSEDYLAPRTPLEETLAGLWIEVLGEERTGGRVGVHDNFFDLGGHSLAAARLAARLRSVLGVDLPLRELFEAPTLAKLAARLGRGGSGRVSGAGAMESIPRVPRPAAGEARFPVSFSQLREWILDRLEPGTPAYNVPGPMRITGPLSIPVLAGVFQEVVRRHEALRTTFAAGGEEPVQVVAATLSLTLPVIDLGGLPPVPGEAELRRLFEEDLGLGFDLAAGPLIRVRLVRSGPEDATAFLTLHHIISDGWSMGVLAREVGALYEAFSLGRPSPLPDLPVQYPDFAVWQGGRLQGEALEEQVAYWRRQLAGAPPLLELSTDRPRPAVRTSRGASLPAVLPAGLVAPLAALAARQGGSLFMPLLAAWQALLARFSGQEDVAVGTFSGNRGRTELEGLIGFFINTLVLRTDLAGAPSFRELLARVRDVTLGAYAHQDIPFEKLLESLGLPRDPSHTPVFQTLLVLHNFPRQAIELSRITLTPLTFETHRSDFDLSLVLTEGPEGLAGRIDYSTDLFEEATIARLLGHLKTLIEGAAADPDRGLWDFPLLRPAERTEILESWSRSRDEPPGAPLLHRLFAAQASRSPNAVAVEAEGQTWTYAELEARAARLARRLRGLGVGPESRVALAVDRSPDMLAGMLGVLAAGGAYVPLDPAYPQDRLAFMLEDSGAAVLLTQGHLASRLPAGKARVVLLDAVEPEGSEEEPGPVALSPENAAYVIYTSGSTGRPKGVVVSHRSIAAYARTAAGYYGIGPADRVLQFGSISFDTSAEEIYPALIAGAALVLRPEDMAVSMARFLGEMERLRITLLALQTAFWHEIVAGLSEGLAYPPALRLVAFGGEEALADRLAAWRRCVGSGVRLVNTYGPTEATIVSTYRELAEPDGDPEVPIGYPIPGARIYVLDRRLEPVPAGVNGELMIGGVGLARGYLGRPDLTAERFVPDPYSRVPGARLYRTGDLARFRFGGDLLFAGRADRQLKVRGFRIEPGEIEAALRLHPALRDAVAGVRGGEADKRLVAWIVPREGQAAVSTSWASELRTFLRDRLPEPMVPSLFVPVAALPLTPSGKLDRRALPDPEGVRPDLPGYTAPATALERTIAEIFRDLLRVDRVGLNDNFFDLGGHSLLVVRAHQRLRDALEREIPVVDLFRFPTVALLARHLGTQEEKPTFERVQGLAGQQKAAQLRQKQAMAKLRRPGPPKK